MTNWYRNLTNILNEDTSLNPADNYLTIKFDDTGSVKTQLEKFIRLARDNGYQIKTIQPELDNQSTVNEIVTTVVIAMDGTDEMGRFVYSAKN